MSQASEALFAPLQLKSGQVLGNRIAMGSVAMVRYQMRRLGAGKKPALGVGPAFALATDQLVLRRALRGYSPWLKSRPRSARVVGAQHI